MAAIATKVCTKCGETKAVEEFCWENRAKGKRKPRCKVCRSADRKQYYQTNREAALAQQRQYREDNREAVLAHQRTPEARALRNASQNARNATPEGKLLKRDDRSPPQVLQRHKARACDHPAGRGTRGLHASAVS